MDDSLATMLRGSITRIALRKLIVDQNCVGLIINLLHPSLTMNACANEVPPVCLHPPCVPPDALLKDVYITMKVNEEEAVFVVDANHLLGVISYRELLGHDLSS